MLRCEYELYDANIGGMYYLTAPAFWYILLPGNEWKPDLMVEWTALVAFLMPVYKMKKYQISIYI